MKIEIPNELGFKCLKFVDQGLNVEQAVTQILKDYTEAAIPLSDLSVDYLKKRASVEKKGQVIVKGDEHFKGFGDD